MLNIYYGRENLDKEKFIFDNLDPKGRALLVVPDQFTLDFERDLFSHLGTKALMDIEVISMSRLGYNLLSELGGSKRTFIDQYGRHMILAEIASSEAEKLSCFRGLERKSAFIESVNDIISELKQYNAKPEDLKAIADSLNENSYTRMKLNDLYLLFSKYEQKIAGKYTDSEDYIDLFLGKISQSKLIKDNTIWVYGFDSFAPKALSVLGELMNYAKSVNVVLTYDDNNTKDKDLFKLTEKVIENLIGEAEARGIEYSKQALPKYYEKSLKSGIATLERELYAVPANQAIDSDGLKLVEAASLYNEAESAASYVLGLVRDEGYKLKDIRVICNDQEIRGPIMKRIFKEYGIELFSDESRAISDHPIIQFVISLMEVVTESYRTDRIFRMLKSGFSDLDENEIIDLENYAIKYKIKGNMWKKPFIKGELEFGVDELGRLESLRVKALSHMESFLKLVKSSKTNLEFIDHFYDYLYDEIKLPERILEMIKLDEAAGRVDLADQAEQVWSSMIAILDQMRAIIADDKFEIEQFKELFTIGLKQVKVGVLPPTKDGLIMGNIERTRMENVKAVIVVGANEGVLPKEGQSQGVFLSDEKELFEDRGMKLFKTDNIKLMEERLAIYRNLSKAKEKLYISYSMANEDGKSISPSTVFTKLREIFGKEVVEKDVLNQADLRKLVNPNISGLRHLTEALDEVSAKDSKLAEEYKGMLDWYKENAPEKLATIRAGLTYSNKQEAIGAKLADSLYKKDINEALSLSPSRIEKFARCPFSHFINYGLKPDERRVFEVAPREIGDIYHECLMALTKELTKEGQALNDPDSRWMTITREETKDFVEKTVKEHVKTYREGLFELGSEEKYRTKRIIEICDKVCWAAIEQVRQGEIIASKFEESFNRSGGFKPIEVKTKDGQTVYIEGKIDRADILPGDRVKIIDYKTGKEEFDIKEAKAGYRLQLMLYLRAAKEEKRKPAGVYYFHIQENSFNVSGKDVEEVDFDQESKKAFKLNGLTVNNDEVIRAIAGDFSGYSDTIPIRNTKEKGISGNENCLISEEEFKELEGAVEAKVSELVDKLTTGDISIYPMKTKDRMQCTYCQYKGICRFDPIFEGSEFNKIE